MRPGLRWIRGIPVERHCCTPLSGQGSRCKAAHHFPLRSRYMVLAPCTYSYMAHRTRSQFPLQPNLNLIEMPAARFSSCLFSSRAINVRSHAIPFSITLYHASGGPRVAYLLLFRRDVLSASSGITAVLPPLVYYARCSIWFFLVLPPSSLYAKAGPTLCSHRDKQAITFFCLHLFL